MARNLGAVRAKERAALCPRIRTGAQARATSKERPYSGALQAFEISIEGCKASAGYFHVVAPIDFAAQVL